MGLSSDEARSSQDSDLRTSPNAPTKLPKSFSTGIRGASTNDLRESQRMAGAQELMVELHREEKIRDAAGAMLSEIDYGQGQQHKHHSMKLNLNSLKSDSNRRKKVRAEFDTAEERVQRVRQQLLELGIDEDDELSSGDEDGFAGSSTMFIDDDYLLNEDISARGPYMMGSSSAASSAVDLTAARQPQTSSIDKPAASEDKQSYSTLATDRALTLIYTVLENLEPQSSDVYAAVDTLSELIHTVRNVRSELKLAAPWSLACDCIRPFLLDKDPSKIGLGLRLARVFMVDATAAAHFRESLLLDLLLVQVLAKDDHDKNHELRLGAIQLVRMLMATSAPGTQSLPLGICRALVAVAEQSNDDIRHVSLETLAELGVVDPERVFEAGGLNALLSAITTANEPTMGSGSKGSNNKSDTKPAAPAPQLGGPVTSNNITAAPTAAAATAVNASSQPITAAAASTPAVNMGASLPIALSMILVGAADRPHVRNVYLRGGRDLSSLLTPFTDVDTYSVEKFQHKEFMNHSTLAMQVILRSWAGLMCFDLRLFVQCMVLPLGDIQEKLLNVLDSVLWLPPALDYATVKKTSATNCTVLPHQFTAILLHRLQRAELQERLVNLQTEGYNERIKRMAQKLGAKIFALSAQLISRHAIVSQSMALPPDLAESLSKAKPHGLPTASIALFETEAELLSMSESLSQRSPSIQTFIRFGVSIDDASFKRLLQSTHVLDTKLFRQWNWDSLMELVQGPLRSPKRLDEVTKGSKFLKRLFAFYRPFKYRFSNLTITREHLRCVDVGKELMRSLLETPEGVRYLAHNKLFRQIAECLAQLDPLSGIMSNEPLLSIRRFKSTLCCAYSELIGVLSSSLVGQQILAQIRIFNMFYRVCDINREDIVRSIICALDYRLEGHPRLILAKALTTASRSTRLYATEFVGHQLATEEPHLWAIDLMVEQLYDVEPGVGQAAVHGLHNMCAASGQALDYTISLKPYLGHLQDAAEPLRILFMSRPQGFNILLAEFEHRDMSHWAPGFNEAYVDKVEAYLEYINTTNITFKSNDESPANDGEVFKFPRYAMPSKRQFQGAAKVPAPAHFYGELALTEQGCRFLQLRGALMELMALIEKVAKTTDRNWPIESIRRVKGALWAIGHVASREKGAALLSMPVVENICIICKNASVLSLRGTAYYALGLFALSSPGAELIHQCNWDVVYNVYGRPVGVALPPEEYYSKFVDQDEYFQDDVLGSVDQQAQPDENSGALSVDLEPMKQRDSPFSPLSVLRSRSSSVFTIGAGDLSNIPRLALSQVPGLILDPNTSQADQSVSDIALDQHHPLDHDAPTPQIRAPSIEAPSITSQASEGSGNVFDFDAAQIGVLKHRTSSLDMNPATQRKEKLIEVLLKYISQLGSSMHSQPAAKSLIAMRALHPSVFQSGDALRHVLKLLASGQYKQAVRRFVFGLFNIHVCMEKLYKRTKS